MRRNPLAAEQPLESRCLICWQTTTATVGPLQDRAFDFGAKPHRIQRESYEKFLQLKLERCRRPRQTRSTRCVQERLSDPGLRQSCVATVRLLHARNTEIRCGRMPRSRHDLFRAVEGDCPFGCLGCGYGNRYANGVQHQRTRGLLR